MTFTTKFDIGQLVYFRNADGSVGSTHVEGLVFLDGYVRLDEQLRQQPGTYYKVGNQVIYDLGAVGLYREGKLFSAPPPNFEDDDDGSDADDFEPRPVGF